MLTTLRQWTRSQWLTAAVAAMVIAAVVGLPTDVIPNPVFGRSVAAIWWSYPVVVATALLGGLLAATYVRGGSVQPDAQARQGGIGGLLSFFAVGCPVCNKLVVLALGVAGAREWFEPVQPLLAVASLGLLGYALRARLRNSAACVVRVS